MTSSVANLGIDGLEDVEQIGTGGSSRVYRARQVDLDRVVAVKVLNLGGDTDVAKRFDRERKAMGRLSLHDGIVPVYSTGTTAHGEPYLVMPFYPNGSLQDLIETGAMEWETALRYVDVAAETIAAAHDAGVVHLDLKPANILLTKNGSPRIADFGIAKITGSPSVGTTQGTAFTPAYSAPETFLEGQTSAASDVYGLGATLWALLVGHPPFLAPSDDANLMAVIGRVVNNAVGDLRGTTPDPVCAVIEKAMAKTPAERYQTAREFSTALKQASVEAVAITQAATTAALPHSASAAPLPVANPESTLFPDLNTTVIGSLPAASPQQPLMASGNLEQPPMATGSRSLLEGSTGAVALPQGGMLPPAPESDFWDRFRIGPVAVGVAALVLVFGGAVWVLTQAGDQIDTENVAPAGPEVDGLDNPQGGLPSDSGSGGGSDGDAAIGSASSDDSASTPTTTPTSEATTASTPTTRATTASTPTTTPSTPSTPTTTESTPSTPTTTPSTPTTTPSTPTTTPSTPTTTPSTPTTTPSTPTTEADPPSSPRGLAATVEGSSVELNWRAGAGARPDAYIIRRNGTRVGRVTTSSFTDDPGDGTFSYVVTSVSDGVESEGVSATVTLGPAEITSLTLAKGETVLRVSFATDQCVSYRIGVVDLTDPGDPISPATGPTEGSCTDSATRSFTIDGEHDYQVNLVVRNANGDRTTRVACTEGTC